CLHFFFHAEGGIRDSSVTGVQTCALPICDYLLACDMEMDPVPGYRFASWETGYGDVECAPDLATLRRAAWLEKTAIVICDVKNEIGRASCRERGESGGGRGHSSKQRERRE